MVVTYTLTFMPNRQNSSSAKPVPSRGPYHERYGRRRDRAATLVIKRDSASPADITLQGPFVQGSDEVHTGDEGGKEEIQYSGSDGSGNHTGSPKTKKW